jgi:hypothetical protein
MAIAVGLPGAARADDPTAPAHFYDKTYRLDVNLEDVDGAVYSATLNDIPSTVPWAAQQWITFNIDTATFDLSAANARCFLVSTKAQSVDCSQIATMVDAAADGGVDATVLAQPVDNGPDGMSFSAKKITVWVDESGNDVPPPDDGTSSGGDSTPPPVPAKFYAKNIRLDVNLEDVAPGPLFDAVLNDIPASVPSSFSAYLDQFVGGSTFELDASHATCFTVRRGVQNQIGCATLASWLDATADGGIDATILARAVSGEELSYTAKKITIFL